MYRRNPLTLVAFAALIASAGCKDSSGPDKPGAPVHIQASAGDAQKGRAGTVLSAPIAAKVTDAKGRGVPNVDVIFQPATSSGTVNPTSAKTNGAGIAITSWTMPTAAGLPVSVRAVLLDTLTGALVDTTRFNAEVIGGLPASMQLSSAPARAATGTTITTLGVLLLDSYGNRSPGVVVNWSVSQGGGAVSAPTSVTNASGIASISYTLGTTAGTNRLTASTGLLSGSFSIEALVPGIPSRLYQPTYPSQAGVGKSVLLSIRVFDGLDMGVPGQTVTWTRTAGDGSVSAATSITDDFGDATTILTLGNTEGTNMVNATVGTMTSTFAVQGRVLPEHLVELGMSAFGIARTSAGRFVTSLIANGSVAIFDEAAPNARTTIPVDGTPTVVAVDDAGAFAYVANMQGYVEIISLSTKTVVKRLPVPGAHSLTMSPRGDRVYVASYYDNVYAVSTSTREIVDSVDVAGGPWGIAFKTNATDSLMYVSARDGGTITEVNMRNMAVLHTYGILGRPHGVAISPDGQTLYVADNTQGQVKAVSTSSGAVIASVALPGSFGIAISPDGTTLYVTTDNAQIAVITASTLTIAKRYDTLRNARQIIVSPDGATAWAASEGGWIDVVTK